jgi:serine protease Do
MLHRFSPLALALLLAHPAPLVVMAAPTHSQQKARTPSLAELSRSLQDLAEKVSPSVVQILVTASTFGPDAPTTASGVPATRRASGSGVVVHADGYVVTNAHVVENATRIEVEIPFAATGGDPGRSILGRRGRIVGAQIVSTDDETDLAVLKIAERGLPVLPYGDSDGLRAGQLVLAFGSPLGLSSSVTMGVVSAVARQLEPEHPMIYVQTDAPINPGNSGGALVDTDGRLVGINTKILSQGGGSEGIGFAAPSNIVRNVVDQMITFGRVRRGEIGVNAQTITPTLAEALGLPVRSGVIIGDVAANSPAARSGLQRGDLVATLDGKPMENGRQFRINIYARAGQQVSLDVLRGAQRIQLRVPVAERAGPVGRLADLIGAQQGIPQLGITVLDLTPAITEMLPAVRRDRGAVIARVGSDAPLSAEGRLLVGDVVYELNGRTITNGMDLKNAAAALKIGVPAVLVVEREGVLHYVSFRSER